ncbi:MAG: patatin-like phospholipase family protein, partial [Planctomyces sp.]
PKHRGADGAGVCQQDILLEETREIRWRRQAIGQPVPEQDPVRDLVGLAISGGGIRSATFSLGVIQALAHHGILKQVDFLSTVSGGGYAGCFLSTYLDSDEPGVGPGRGERPLSSENGVDSHAIRHIR